MAEIEVTRPGASVTVAPGDRISIRIPENATTGYQWSIEELGDPVELESTELIPPGETAPGGGGQRHVTLLARRPGRSRVRLRLERSWEREAIDRFEIDVTVA